MKNDDIISKANNTIAIICHVVDNMRGGYTIVPQEAAIGKIDDETDEFLCSDNNEVFESIEDNIDYYDPEKRYYCFAKSVDELRDTYDPGLSKDGLAMAYFATVNEVLSTIRVYDGEIDISNRPLQDVQSGTNDPLDLANEVKTVFNRDKEEEVISGAPAIIKKEHMDKPSYKMDPLSPDFDIDELIDEMNSRVINNEETIEDICTTLVSNITAEDPEDVENILSMGPTGSGKSQTFKDLKKLLTTPMVFCDSNQLSSAGYVGKSVDDFLKDLYLQAGRNSAVANKSVFILDEIDKLKSSGLEIKEAAQDSLLKVVEGHLFQVALDKMETQIVPIDTTGMTIVGLGAFSEIFEQRKKDNDKNDMGFNAKEKVIQDVFREVTTDELIKYGFKPEFIPRFHNINVYRELDGDGLRHALLESKNSPLIRKINRYLKQYNAEIDYDDSFIEAFVEVALAKKEGGRSLNKIAARTFKKADKAIIKENQLNRGKAKVLKLTGDTVKNPRNFDIRIK